MLGVLSESMLGRRPANSSNKVNNRTHTAGGTGPTINIYVWSDERYISHTRTEISYVAGVVSQYS